MKEVFLCSDESQKHFCVQISHRNVSVFRSITEMFPCSDQSQKCFHVQISHRTVSMFRSVTEAFSCSDQSQKCFHVQISHRSVFMFRSDQSQKRFRVIEGFPCSDQVKKCFHVQLSHRSVSEFRSITEMFLCSDQLKKELKKQQKEQEADLRGESLVAMEMGVLGDAAGPLVPDTGDGHSDQCNCQANRPVDVNSFIVDFVHKNHGGFVGRGRQ